MYITYCTVLYLKIMTYLRMITNVTYDNWNNYEFFNTCHIIGIKYNINDKSIYSYMYDMNMYITHLIYYI